MTEEYILDQPLKDFQARIRGDLTALGFGKADDDAIKDKLTNYIIGLLREANEKLNETIDRHNDEKYGRKK